MKLIPTKRTLKRWAIGLGIVLGLLLLVNAVMAWRTEARFRELVAAVRAEGDPASIAELAPPPIPVDENAAALIDKLSPRLDEFDKEYAEFYNTDLGMQLDNLAPGELLTDEQAAAMRAILDRYPDLEQQIHDAMAAPHYASTADFSLAFNPFLEAQLERMQKLRTFARFVNWRVQTLLAEGKHQEAVDWSLSLLEFSALVKGEPAIVSYLVTIAIRNIAFQDLHQALLTGPTDAATHARVDEVLKRLENETNLEKVLRTERALSITASIDQGWNQAPPVLGNMLGWPIKQFFLPPIELYDEIIPLANVPYPKARKEFEAGGTVAVPTGRGVLADLLVPSLEAAMRSSARDVALIRSLRVLNALQLAGEDAQGLADINLPAEATTDPFTGKPLIVKKTDQGWLVYSVGEDLKDDGGKFDLAEDNGFGPTQGEPEGELN
ncbi:hypothetical protein [Aeoliella sp. SH292]|uniref:hypothetical protein n=1 Tax=Aeoliella sp. SH292 TaxID=3454464 RepID=UPI003F98C912